MNLRSFFLAAGLAVTAGAADAQTTEERILTQLSAQGFTEITISRTLLGRVRIVARSGQYWREVVFNPSTGVVLRDYWEELPEAEQTAVPPAGTSTSPGNSGNAPGQSNGNNGQGQGGGQGSGNSGGNGQGNGGGNSGGNGQGNSGGSGNSGGGGQGNNGGGGGQGNSGGGGGQGNGNSGGNGRND